MARKEWATYSHNSTLLASTRGPGRDLLGDFVAAHSQEVRKFTVVRTIIDLLVQHDSNVSTNVPLRVTFAVYPWPEVAINTEPSIETPNAEAHYTDYLLLSQLQAVSLLSSGSSLDGRYNPPSERRHYDIRAARSLDAQQLLTWCLYNHSAVDITYALFARLLVVIA